MRFALLVLLGAAAATGFAPLQWWPVTLVALAWWLRLVHDAPTLKAALWRGWLFGVGHFTVNNNWIQHAFTYQDEMPHWLGYIAPLALALYLAVYPMLAAGLAWRLASPRSTGDLETPPGTPFALVAGAAWIAGEWLRSQLFTGYAWDPLGTIWLPVIGVARLAAWVGTYALSGLTVAVAATLLLLLQRRWAPPAIAAALLALAAASAPLGRAPDNPDAPLLRVVQPNLDQGDRGLDDSVIVLQTLEELSGSPGPRPRLLLWPEGVVRDMVEDGYPFWAYRRASPLYVRRRMAALLGPRDRLLAGGTALQFDANGDLVTATNSVFAVTPDAQLAGRYDKVHLVPYGEYLPMRALLEPIGLSRLVPGSIDFAPGPGPSNLVLPGFGAIGVQLCYEIIFSGQVTGKTRPRLLFNPSNDAWFGAWGPPQHLAQARMRAIEEGLPIARATPNGISAVIAADGRLLATVPHHRAGAIELPIPAALPPTMFSRMGNWAALLVAAALLLLAVAIRQRPA